MSLGYHASEISAVLHFKDHKLCSVVVYYSIILPAPFEQSSLCAPSDVFRLSPLCVCTLEIASCHIAYDGWPRSPDAPDSVSQALDCRQIPPNSFISL